MLNVTTPAFLVDRPRLTRNCNRMREKASAVHFRPHVKTHKSVEIGRIQHGGHAGAITVSTLAEAEAFAREAGIAECTPNLRASYDAAQTTLRNPGHPTITGFPRSSGASRCSTDA